MSINERIEQQLKQHAIILFMKGTPDFPQCGFSSRVVQALNICGIQYATVNILEDGEMREALKVYSNWPTYPQLYVKGELLGGCDIVMDMFSKGELQALLETAVA